MSRYQSIPIEEVSVDIEVNKELKDKLSRLFTTNEDTEAFLALMDKIDGKTIYNVDCYTDDDLDITTDDIDDSFLETCIEERGMELKDSNDNNARIIVENNNNLLYRLQCIGYNFGNNKPLTQEECKKLSNILEDIKNEV